MGAGYLAPENKKQQRSKKMKIEKIKTFVEIGADVAPNEVVLSLDAPTHGIQILKVMDKCYIIISDAWASRYAGCGSVLGWDIRPRMGDHRTTADVLNFSKTHWGDIALEECQTNGRDEHPCNIIETSNERLCKVFQDISKAMSCSRRISTVLYNIT